MSGFTDRLYHQWKSANDSSRLQFQPPRLPDQALLDLARYVNGFRGIGGVAPDVAKRNGIKEVER